MSINDPLAIDTLREVNEIIKFPKTNEEFKLMNFNIKLMKQHKICKFREFIENNPKHGEKLKSAYKRYFRSLNNNIDRVFVGQVQN